MSSFYNVFHHATANFHFLSARPTPSNCTNTQPLPFIIFIPGYGITFFITKDVFIHPLDTLNLLFIVFIIYKQLMLLLPY